MIDEFIRTMQVSIVLMALFTAGIWSPVARRIALDWQSSREQISMTVKLWRILVGTSGAVVGALVGFFPPLLTGLINYLGFGKDDPALTTGGSLFLFFLLILWFASWGKAARLALREKAPHPWDSEQWLDWPYLQFVAVMILVTAACLVALEQIGG
jgi:uncharacterized protein YacL